MRQMRWTLGTRMMTASGDTSIAQLTVPELKEQLRERGLKVRYWI